MEIKSQWHVLSSKIEKPYHGDINNIRHDRFEDSREFRQSFAEVVSGDNQSKGQGKSEDDVHIKEMRWDDSKSDELALQVKVVDRFRSITLSVEKDSTLVTYLWVEKLLGLRKMDNQAFLPSYLEKDSETKVTAKGGRTASPFFKIQNSHNKVGEKVSWQPMDQDRDAQDQIGSSVLAPEKES
ncbi:hypothetical protein QYF36_004684 [Acer negundo]|nr:hypothetical protein QYF36_004684 [Acer negundo]